MLHGIIGGIMADINGGKFGEGLTVGAINEILIGELSKLTKKDANDKNTPLLSSEQIRWISAIVGGVVSETVGGNAGQGGSIADSATRNNYYQHIPVVKQALEYVKEEGLLEKLKDNEVIILAASGNSPYLAGATGGIAIDKFGNYYEFEGLTIGSPGGGASYVIVSLKLEADKNPQDAIKEQLTGGKWVGSASISNVTASGTFNGIKFIPDDGVGVNINPIPSASFGYTETKNYGNIYDTDFFELYYDNNRLVKDFYVNNPAKLGETYKSYYSNGAYMLFKQSGGQTYRYNTSSNTWIYQPAFVTTPGWIEVATPYVQ